MKKLIFSLAVFLSMNCFADDLSSSGYATNGVRQQGTAIKGEVIDVHQINIDPSPTATVVGKSAGAIIGGALGAGLSGKNTYTKIAVGTLSGLLGGVIGDLTTDKVASQKGVEVIVATEKGEVVVITQSISDGNSLSLGDQVWVVRSGNAVRAIRRNPSV